MFTHIDQNNFPTMVDVSDKSETKRTATAVGSIILPSEIIDQIKEGELHSKKGPVFATAIIAGTQAVKRTSDLIPFCHPLMITSCKFNIKHDPCGVTIECTVSLCGKTGVEMEALTGVSVALLTIYDMCKAFSHNMTLKEISLKEKTGGKSDIIFSK